MVRMFQHSIIWEMYCARGELERLPSIICVQLKSTLVMFSGKWTGNDFYAALKRDDEALRYFKEAVQLNPQNTPGYFNVAVQLDAEAIKRLEQK